jgi:beta-glucanase (GH16 family)
VWSEEFDSEGPPSPERWTFDLGHGTRGWGNREAQCYGSNPSECVVENGRLLITGSYHPDSADPYASARIHTYGKASWQYGRFEIRARLPVGGGTWPAIWMLSDAFREGTSWPHCGEIDIMEHVGRDPGRIHFSLHSQRFNHADRTQVTETHVRDGVTDGFHVYTMEWDATGFSFGIDDDVLSTFPRGQKSGVEDWPFDQPYHLVLNLALGGHMGGEIDNDCLPARFEVDYVRVYQKVD